MENLTPKQIVAELDKYIVGQHDAKRAVAVAIRNRWRRQQLPEDMRRDVSPKNIIMIGPTGVGKTEIARRLASLTGAPLVPIFTRRLGYLRYEVTAYPPIEVPRRPTDADLGRAAQQAADDMQSFIRSHPTQWFHFAG